GQITVCVYKVTVGGLSRCEEQLHQLTAITIDVHQQVAGWLTILKPGMGEPSICTNSPRKALRRRI
ncbi:MAG: hypothetical protein IMY76_08005, partial [Chloroflexi bacterium]|nr:hypothetical protein [Chloroflexota bacterium]